MGMVLALALTAASPQEDEPRILEAAARLATQVQLRPTVQQGAPRVLQRIPKAVKIAMVAGGGMMFYFALRRHGDFGSDASFLTLATGAGIASFGAMLLVL